MYTYIFHPPDPAQAGSIATIRVATPAKVRQKHTNTTNAATDEYQWP